jgi:hypothetical protein
MTNTALVEQIVAKVLQQLQPAPAARPAPSPPSLPAASTGGSTTEAWLDVPVITAEILQHHVQRGQRLRIAARSLLTPSARDWLKAQGIECLRGGPNTSAARGKGRRQVLVSTVTAPVRSLIQSLPREWPDWKHQLLGQADELLDAGVRAICTSEADLLVAVTDRAAMVACRANRHPAVRAAVLTSAAELPALADSLGVNLLVIDPRGRSFIDLRNVLRECAALPPPRCPTHWG